MPNDRLFQGKEKTFFIEQNNNRQRHWFARYQSKTLANSRSIEMIAMTMRIFSAIQVNKTLKIDHALFA